MSLNEDYYTLPRKPFRLIVLLIALFTISILVLSCGDDDPVKPGNPPDITQFSASPSDIMPGDSSLITCKALRADSMVLFPAGSRLAENDSGGVYVKPALPTAYTLVAYNKDGVDSARAAITMSGAAAHISSFTASQPVIVTGDSTQLSWTAVQTDSLVIDHGIGKVATATSGSVWVKPTVSTTYRAVAYYIANDTATVNVTVEVPADLQAPNGLFYKGDMGSSTLNQLLDFVVVNATGGILTRPWVKFELVEGDGTLSADSLQPGVGGTATLAYTFSGAQGHAIIRAKVTEVDSIDVYVRANTLIPGTGGQGQYVLLDTDEYYMVKNFNGEPERVDAAFPYNYVVYEQSLGVVVILEDNGDGVPQNLEPVYGVIVNTVYDKKTAEGIGIGSRISDVIAAYGEADSSYVDPTPPAADVYVYRDPNMVYFADPSDSSVFEIHLIYTPIPGAPTARISAPPSASRPQSSENSPVNRGYKLERYEP